MSVNNKSYSLIRTNPRLTSNVKLVFDTKDNLYLDSFSVNKELNKSVYKKYILSPEGDYSFDLYNFWSGLTRDYIYYVGEKDDSTKIKKTFAEQYDFTYNYGTYFKNSTLYNEELAIFSPLWIENKIPEYFVIFRLDGPITKQIDSTNLSSIDSYINNPQNFYKNYIQDSKIIKTIKIKDSNLGKYLSNYINSKNYPKYPVNVNFNKGSNSSWSGIDINNGGFSTKFEDLYKNYVLDDKTIIEQENYITEGFKRNGLVIANLINIEFLFDDNTKEDGKFYRYFGFYVDEKQIGEFKLNVDKFNNIQDETQTPNLINIFNTRFDNLNVNIKNNKGVLLPIEDIRGDIINFNDITNNSLFPYIKDKFDNLYSINQKNNFELNHIRLKNDTINLHNFIGVPKTSNRIKTYKTNVNGRPSIGIKLLNTNFTTGDEIKIEYKRFNSDIIDSYTLKADGSNQLKKGQNNGQKFSINGNINDISKAIVKALKYIELNLQDYQIFDSLNINDTVYIYSKNTSEIWNNLKLSIFTKNINNIPYKILNDLSQQNNTITDNYTLSPLSDNITEYGNIYTFNFTGGNSNPKSRLIINKLDINYFNNTNDTIYIKTVNGYSDIRDISLYLDEPIIEFGKIVGFKNVDNFLVLNLNTSDDIVYSDNVVFLYKEFKLSNGYLSLYDIRDFDFDLHSTEYNKSIDVKNKSDLQDINLSYYLNRNNENVNEYDKLNENDIPNFAITSRVVPYINKWIYVNSKDIRFNDLRLNFSDTFGVTNFSPSFDEFGINEEYFTHEWYFLQKYPEDFNFEDRLNSYSYFNEDININKLKDLNLDYFNEYFTVDNIKLNNNTYHIPTVEKYSIFDGGDDIKYSETILNGVKIRINDFNVNKNRVSKPTNKYNGYKISSILYNSYSNDIEIIKNDKSKNITILIPYFYKIKDDIGNTKNSITRSDLYLKSINKGKSIEIPNISLFDNNVLFKNINNLFNIQFNTTINFNDIIENKDLDSIKIEFTYNDSKLIFSDIEYILQDSIHFETLEFIADINNPSTFTLDSTELTNYIFNKNTTFSNFILFSSLSGLIDEDDYYLFRDIVFKNINYIIFENDVDLEFKYFNTKLNDISFAKIAERINNKSINVKFIELTDNGDLYDTFEIKLIKPTYFIKSSYLESKPLNKRLINYNDVGIIGYNLTSKDRLSLFEMSRISGNYTPKTYNVIQFSNNNNIINLNLKNSNIKIFDYIKNVYNNDNLGIIKNLYFNKVNTKTSNISRISDKNIERKIYPLISEISIDKSNFNIFKSNWDVNYYREYESPTIFKNIVGTNEPIEQKSFFGSKILSTPKNIKLNHIINYTHEFLGDVLTINVNVKDELLEYFISNGYDKEFEKFIIDKYSFGYDNFIEDVKQYLLLNVIDKYFTFNINLYEQKTQNLGININNLISTEEKLSYNKIINFKSNIEDNALNFKIIYNITTDNVDIAFDVELKHK